MQQYSYSGQEIEMHVLGAVSGYRAIAAEGLRGPRTLYIAGGTALSSLERITLEDGAVAVLLTGYNANAVASDPINARIYFGVSSGAIFSSTYDGTDVREVYPVPSGVQSITAMAIDPNGGWLYWAASRAVRRMPLGGGPVEVIVGPYPPGPEQPYVAWDIALDLVHDQLYWSEWDILQQGEAPFQTSGRIVRSNLDGSNPQVAVQDYRYDDIPGVPEIGINPKSFAIDPVAGILFAYDDQNGHLVKYCLDGSCYDDDFEGPNLSYDPIDMAVIPAIPEPSTAALAVVGVAAMLAWRRRLRRTSRHA